MRIAQVAPPFESVPPTRYGGTERVVSLLTEELVRRGYDVTLFASGDSTTQARLIPTVDTALWRLDEVRDPLPYWAIALGEAYRRARDGEFDVVHAHLDFQAFPCAVLCEAPTITTPARTAGPAGSAPPLRPLPRGRRRLDLEQPAVAAPDRPLAGDRLQRRRRRPPALQPDGRRVPRLPGADLPRRTDRAIGSRSWPACRSRSRRGGRSRTPATRTFGPTGSITSGTSGRCFGTARSRWSARSATPRSRSWQRPGAALPDRLAGAVRAGDGRGARLWYAGGGAAARIGAGDRRARRHRPGRRDGRGAGRAVPGRSTGSTAGSAARLPYAASPPRWLGGMRRSIERRPGCRSASRARCWTRPERASAALRIRTPGRASHRR